MKKINYVKLTDFLRELKKVTDGIRAIDYALETLDGDMSLALTVPVERLVELVKQMQFMCDAIKGEDDE